MKRGYLFDIPAMPDNPNPKRSPMRLLIINGVLVNPRTIEIAQFEAETKTLSVYMNGVVGLKQFSGDDAAEAAQELTKANHFLPINGTLINPMFLETAEFDPKTETVTVALNGAGIKQFQGGNAPTFFAALKNGE